MINIPQLIKVSVKTWFEISVTPSCFFKVSRWRWVPHLLNFLSYRILLSALFISFPFDVFYLRLLPTQVLQIDDASKSQPQNQLFPFRTEDDPPSNSMYTSTKGQKGEKGERVR